MRGLPILICLSLVAVAQNASAAKPRATPASEPQTGLQSLTNATQAEVRAKFGEPHVARAEGAGAFWTYQLPDCALFVFFRKDAKVLKVSGLSAGPRRRGEPAPDAAACIDTAEQP